ncbi:hypothetical protein C8Q74DRAFT_1368383 [Fomes fomentarius]|nr:hypothetical protein C8Q74DRAFT_1368383 [Fomes fomentarius]
MHQPSNAADRPSSRALNTKTRPPAFIKLDGCKPILSTTSTNTSTNSSAHGTTAFVFTSSRTLRALRDQSEDALQRLSPASSIASSHPSPPTSPTSEYSSHSPKGRASLTLSQVVKHSQGAIDARFLLGPKMRAAGFVNLPNTLGSRSDFAFSSSTPSSPTILPSVSTHFPPTPSDPPTFPPMVFVNPSAVTTTPMWEYQRDMQWSLCSRLQDFRSRSLTTSTRPDNPHSTGPSEFTPGPPYSAVLAPSSSLPLLQHPRGPTLPGPSESSSSDPSGIISSGSSYTSVSSSSTSSSLPSVEEKDADVQDRSRSDKGKARAREVEPAEYPFPATCDSRRSPASRRGSRASSATASPTIVGAVPPTTCPNALWLNSSSTTAALRQDVEPGEAPSPRRSRRSSDEKRARVRAKGKPAHEPTPTFATAKRLGNSRMYSLTELCDASPFVWMTKSDIFAPPAPINRSPLTPTASYSLMSTSAASRPPPPVIPPRPQRSPPRHRRHRTIMEGCPSDPGGRSHRIVSAPIRMPSIRFEHEPPPDQRARHPNRTNKEREYDKRGLDCEPSQQLFATSEVHHSRTGAAAHVQDGGGHAARGRGRNTRGKLLGASETASERAAAEAEADMDREKAKALKELAALTLGCNENDREFAYHLTAEHDCNKVLKQKQRVQHKLGQTLPDECPSESEVTMVDIHLSALKTVP